MKYIVLSDGMREVPILFPNQLVHAVVAEAIMKSEGMAKFKPVSAGELSSLDVNAECCGHSSTLDLSSRGRQDDDLIRMYDYLHGLI